MKDEVRTSHIISWLFGIAILAVGLLNIFLVHPIPGVIYLLLSLLYFPPVNDMFKERLGLSISPVVKIIMGIGIIWFTLGVSDLGDMID